MTIEVRKWLILGVDNDWEGAHGASLCSAGNVLYFALGVGFTDVYICKNVYFIFVHFTMLYFNQWKKKKKWSGLYTDTEWMSRYILSMCGDTYISLSVPTYMVHWQKAEETMSN